MLIAAPFYPYTIVPFADWKIPLPGIMLGGWLNIATGVIAIITAGRGRGPLAPCWLAGIAATFMLIRAARFCRVDVGLFLGRSQLSLSEVNRLIIGLGYPPLHIVDSFQINGRALAIGFHLALWGLLAVGIALVAWLIWRGFPALWSAGKRCGCGRWVHRPEEYCPFCGRQLNRVVLCPKCKKPIGDNFAFCPRCGSELKRVGGKKFNTEGES